jgi:hypothetical protein
MVKVELGLDDLSILVNAMQLQGSLSKKEVHLLKRLNDIQIKEFKKIRGY